MSQRTPRSCVQWNRLPVLSGHPVCPAAPANIASVVLTATDRSNAAQRATADAGGTVTDTVYTNNTCTRGSPGNPRASDARSPEGHRHPAWCNAVHDLDPQGHFHIHTAKSEYPLPAGVTVKIPSHVSSDANQDREPWVEVADEQPSGCVNVFEYEDPDHTYPIGAALLDAGNELSKIRCRRLHSDREPSWSETAAMARTPQRVRAILASHRTRSAPCDRKTPLPQEGNRRGD